VNDANPIRRPRLGIAMPDATTWRAVWPVLLLGAFVFVVLESYWRYVGVPTTRDDLGDIVVWSKYLDRPYDWHPYHKYGRMPLYPAVIWLARALSLDVLPDGVLCQAIGVAAWVASLFFVAGIVRLLWPESLRLGVLAWGLFPFTGMVYVVWPVADVLALLFTAAAIYAGLRGRWWGFVVATNLALMAHKSVWPLLLLVALVFWWKKGMRWWHILASGTLLTAYYVWGRLTIAADEPMWLISDHLIGHFSPHSGWSIMGVPIFDGIRTSLGEGGLKAWVKGVIYPSVFIIATVLGVDAVRRRDWLSVACVVPTIAYTITLNRIEIWAVIRFGHPLVFAACSALAARPAWLRSLNRPAAYSAIAAALVVSQLLWGIGRMAEGSEPTMSLERDPISVGRPAEPRE
jgi:hypothetical protein